MSKSKAFILNIIFLRNGNDDGTPLKISLGTLKGKQVMILMQTISNQGIF